MADYIEREALLDRLSKRLKNSVILAWLGGIVVETPAADVAPVVHGRWIDVGHKIRCSVCDNGVFLGTTDPVVHNYEKENFNYCPNCGAKMDGE